MKIPSKVSGYGNIGEINLELNDVEFNKKNSFQQKKKLKSK